MTFSFRSEFNKPKLIEVVAAFHPNHDNGVLLSILDKDVILDMNKDHERDEIESDNEESVDNISPNEENSSEPNEDSLQSCMLNDSPISSSIQVEKLPGKSVNKKVSKAWEVMTNDPVDDYQRHREHSEQSKYLEKDDIINLAINYNLLSDHNLYELILEMYPNLGANNKDTFKLFNLIISHNKLQIFDDLIKEVAMHTIIEQELENNQKKNFKSTKLKMDFKEDQAYQQVISNTFYHAISLRKMRIAYYLFIKYPNDVYANKTKCIDSILGLFKHSWTQSSQIDSIEEVLFLLSKFKKFISYSQAEDLLLTLSEKLVENPEDNFIVF